jgi:glycosyltransferase involved in cell wall biosynthesis
VCAAERRLRLNHLLLVGLLPLRIPLALADMARRRRSLARSWRAVRGRLNRMLPPHRIGAPLRWALLAALERAHRRHPAQLVHMMSGNSSAYAWAARRGLPIIYNENSVPTEAMGVEWWRDPRRHADRIDLVTTVCAAAVPAVRSHLGYRGRIIVVPSTLPDPPTAAGQAGGEDRARGDLVVIGCAARLVACKGVDVLLRAMAALGRRSGARPVRLLVAGAGAQREALERLVGTLGIATQVQFLGHCAGDDMQRFWAAIDVYALASRWEGLPLSVVEAMAYGKPVVATAVAGIAEAVVDGATGLLVPSQAVEPFAQALAALVDDDDRRAAMGRAGRRRFLSCYSTEVVVARLLDAYRNVARPAPAGRP